MKILAVVLFVVLFLNSCIESDDFVLAEKVTVGDSTTEIRKSISSLTLTGLLQETGSASELVFTLTTPQDEYSILFDLHPEMEDGFRKYLGKQVSITGKVILYNHSIAQGKYKVIEKSIYPDRIPF